MRYEKKELQSIVGSKEIAKATLITDMETGKSWIEVSKEITQDFKTKDKDKAIQLVKDLMGGGGRRCFSLEDLANA